MLTDGMLTTGAPMNSIPDGSMNRTAIFAMGFGTGLDVDYPTLASMVAKGKTLSTQQVFHGENAGTIDKFFTNSLATAIGFTNIFDPVVELFEGEHTHLSFTATSADDVFLVTAQGMDFTDKHWSFVLHGPNGQLLYGDQEGHRHTNHCNHCCESPDITTTRSNARLSMVIQQGNTEKNCWVGSWVLMISYKAKQLDKMLMPELGELLFPVSAGPIRGERYARLLNKQNLRKATRNVFTKSNHGLDNRAVGTNSNDKVACSVVMNVYARTNLKINAVMNSSIIKQGEELKVVLKHDISVGSIQNIKGFARLISPNFDLNDLIPKDRVLEMNKINEKEKRFSPKLDTALLLGKIEKDKKDTCFIKDSEVKIVSHANSPLHIHHHDTSIRGTYHLGMMVEGLYFPNIEQKESEEHNHDSGAHMVKDTDFEVFSRILNVSVGVV